LNISQLKAQVNLIDEKVKMEASIPGKTPIIMDYIPPIGTGEGYTSLEVLLISLAACYGTTIKSLITFRLKKEIRGMSLNIEGDRMTEHPMKFHTIRLLLSIDSPDLQLNELTAIAAIAEEKYCPVWAMIKGDVDIETELNIERSTLKGGIYV